MASVVVTFAAISYEENPNREEAPVLMRSAATTTRRWLVLVLLVCTHVCAGWILTLLLTLGVCFVAVALAQIWAMLGANRPLLRLCGALSLAAAAGWLGGRAEGLRGFGFWTAVCLIQAVLTAGSLGVLRVLGYRLVARRSR